jgi:hypothetical protein
VPWQDQSSKLTAPFIGESISHEFGVRRLQRGEVKTGADPIVRLSKAAMRGKDRCRGYISDLGLSNIAR